MTDVYRLLLTAAVEAQHRGNSSLFALIRQFILYFNQTDTLESMITDQRLVYYCLPLTPSSRSYHIDGFIAHVRKECRNFKWMDVPGAFPNGIPPSPTAWAVSVLSNR